MPLKFKVILNSPVTQVTNNTYILTQAALRAPHEVALQCVAGHCYYHRSVFLSLFRLLLLTHFGETPEAKKFYPPIFCHN